MRGYLKQSSVISQCSQCFSLRHIDAEDVQGTPCPTCLRLLGVVFTEVTPLPLGANSYDNTPVKPIVVSLVGAFA